MSVCIVSFISLQILFLLLLLYQGVWSGRQIAFAGGKMKLVPGILAVFVVFGWTLLQILPFLSPNSFALGANNYR